MVLTAGSTIGVVGLGNLGRPMAMNLIDNGWNVVVHDRNEDLARQLVEAGAADGADLGAADVVCFVVPDEKAVWQTLNDGLLDKVSNGMSIVVHSTILPERARSLADAVEAAGGTFAMAPVSGGAERARRGELSLIAGTQETTASFLAPLFETMSSEVFHVGDAAAACAVKLANQLIMFSALAGLHEAMALTQTYDVDDEDVLRFVETATGDTWVGRNWGFFDDVAADYQQSGAPVHLRPWSKDLWEVLEAARDARVSAPFAATLSQIMPGLVEEHARKASNAQHSEDQGATE